MEQASYLTTAQMLVRGRLLLVGMLLLAGLAGAGCKKDKARLADSDEKGKLRRIAENLEEAYASAPLPPLTEPASFAERIEKWDDFRSCTVRTYVARKRDADKRQQQGKSRPSRHASIGDETIEECGVQLAIAKKDTEICDRLAVDYAGPNGEVPLAAVRCWDTRARVFGLPDECPVMVLGAGVVGRNPECLALARRDPSLCPFADSPGRCRALLTNDVTACRGSDGANDCELAFEYWHGLIPSGFGAPLVDPAALADKPAAATFDLRWPKGEHPHVRIEAPKLATGVSWPAKVKPGAAARVATGEGDELTKIWGWEAPESAVQITWSGGSPLLKLAFQPGGAPSGVRPLQPPSATAPVTLLAVWPENPAKFLRCQAGPQSAGDLRYDAGSAQPGAVVTGELKAQRLTCSDGSEMEATVTFRLVILDVR
jgi:hypothetical protein